MRIGEFNERVTCFGDTYTSDGAGGQRATATELFTDWAKVERKSVRQATNNGQVLYLTVYEVTMRSRLDYSGDIAGNDFPSVISLTYRGRTLYVQGFHEIDKDFVMLTATERR